MREVEVNLDRLQGSFAAIRAQLSIERGNACQLPSQRGSNDSPMPV